MADDALCRRCGKCCHEKLILEDEVIILDIPCQHLDVETNFCRIYHDRHERNRRCLPVAEAIKARALAADCPYVRGLPDYKPPIELTEHPEYADRIAALLLEEERRKSGEAPSGSSRA